MESTKGKKQETKPTKQNSDERIMENFANKYSEISVKKSGFFYFSIVLLNLCALVVVMLLYGNTADIVPFKVFWESIDWKIILLMALIVIGIMLIGAFPNYLKIYNKSKTRRYWLSYKTNNVDSFYNLTCVYSRNGAIASTMCLKENNLSNSVSAVELTLSKKIFEKISYIIYTVLFLVIGLFAWPGCMPSWITWIAVISLLFQIVVVVLVGLLNDNKQAVISFVGWFSRLLYKFKLIRDYERFYNNTIDKLVVYNKALRQNKSISFIEIVINILVLFLKHSLLYLVLVSINLDTNDVFWQLMYMNVVLDLALKIWPLPKGTLIYEVVFITLFSKIFFTGYVYWAVVLYRIFDYFVYMMHYLIISFIDWLLSKKKVKQKN